MRKCVQKYSVFPMERNTIWHYVHHYASSDHWPMIEYDSYAYNECMCWTFYLVWLDSYILIVSLCVCVCAKILVFSLKRNTVWHDVHYYLTSDPWSILKDDSYAYKICIYWPFHLIWLHSYYFNSHFMRVWVQI